MIMSQIGNPEISKELQSAVPTVESVDGKDVDQKMLDEAKKLAAELGIDM
jgi:hypothetical protein